LAPYIEFIEDSDFSIAYEDIQSGNVEHLWQLNTKSVFIGSDKKSRYWFRIKFHFSSELLLQEAVLVLPPHSYIYGKLKLWLPSTNDLGGVRSVSTGSALSYESRDIENRFFGFRMPITSEKITILGWSDNTEWGPPAMLPFVLQSQKQFRNDTNFILQVLFAFYAVLGIQIIYNFCLFVSLREPLYGIYSLCVISAMVFCAVFDGTTFFGVIPDDSEVKKIITRINSIGVIALNMIFVWMTVNKYRMPRILSKCFFGLMLATVGGIIYSIYTILFGGSMAEFFRWYSMLCVFFIISIIFIAMCKRQVIAGYLLLVELVLYGGSLSFMLMLDGVIPYSPMVHWGIHWGYAGEALLLSFVLAVRTREMQRSAIINLKKFESLFEDSFEGRFIYSLDDKSMKHNKAFSTLMQYHKEGETSQELKKLLESGEIANYELKRQQPGSGDDLWVSISTQFQKDKRGNAIALEGVVADISERKLKEIAEKKNTMNEALAQAKSQFFAGMSHELRTPLNAVIGYAEMAQRRDLDEDQRIKAVESIEQSGKHMASLINDVLDLSKIEAQKLRIEIISVSVFELIEELRVFISILAEKKKVSFGIDYCFPIPGIIKTDPIRLKQILINLCGNAIKFGEKNNVVIEIYCDPLESTMSFSVKDNGIGLTPEQIKKLFGAYSQADNAIIKDYGGTGLGLNLSKQLALRLGGDIEVESEFGEGSSFTLTVGIGSLENVQWVHEEPGMILIGDLEKNQAGHDILLPNENRDRLLEKLSYLASARVLLIDDDSCSIDILSSYLSLYTTAICIATDGEMAVEIIRTQQFDIVITDYHLPKIMGSEIVKALRLNKRNSKALVLCVTGSTSEDDIEELWEAGVDLQLAKPVASNELIYSLCQLIEREGLSENVPMLELDNMDGAVAEEIQKFLMRFSG